MWNPRLKVSPVVLTVATAALMAGLDRAVPALRIQVPRRELIALPVALAALFITTAAVRRFVRAHTTVMPFRPDQAAALVTTGVYRHTRNPMYLGLLLLLVGAALWTGNVIALLLLPGFVGYLNQFQIAPEEAALLRRFGAAYADYRRRVRRWL